MRLLTVGICQGHGCEGGDHIQGIPHNHEGLVGSKWFPEWKLERMVSFADPNMVACVARAPQPLQLQAQTKKSVHV